MVIIRLMIMMNHLGKSIEPRSSSGHVSQNPRVAKLILMMIITITLSSTLLMKLKMFGIIHLIIEFQDAA